jgi:multidrug resistance efflux pump
VKELETERRKTLNGEPETKVDNNTPTAEDYEALRQELEAEKQKATQLVEEATKPLQERIASLEADLQAASDELQATGNELDGAKAAYAYAVEDFKKLVLASNPLFTPDIIAGDTIEDVKASVDKANALVGKVKEGLEAQAKALAGLTTVPAGAPARGPQSTEGLSTKEKINLGLEQARKKKES